MNTKQDMQNAQLAQDTPQVLTEQVLTPQDRTQQPLQDTGANACVPGCGWLKLFRCFTEWEWYSDTNTVRLFLHLLLRVNYRERRWKGIIIPRGSMVTSLAALAAETTLSVQNVRTCLAHLKSTGEIRVETTPCYTLITVNNYARYQDGGTCSNTSEQQPVNNPSTHSQQTCNKPLTTTKEIKKEINKENIRENSGFAKAQPALAPQAEQSFCEVPCSECKSFATDGCVLRRNAATPGTNTVEKKRGRRRGKQTGCKYTHGEQTGYKYTRGGEYTNGEQIGGENIGSKHIRWSPQRFRSSGCRTGAPIRRCQGFGRL